MKPDWIVKLEAEPCRCERCSFCCGRGNIRVDDHSQPEGWDLETCDQCSGGIVEVCDRCSMLEDWDHESQID
jgi:hypothetical protein